MLVVSIYTLHIFRLPLQLHHDFHSSPSLKCRHRHHRSRRPSFLIPRSRVPFFFSGLFLVPLLFFINNICSSLFNNFDPRIFGFFFPLLCYFNNFCCFDFLVMLFFKIKTKNIDKRTIKTLTITFAGYYSEHKHAPIIAMMLY